MSFTSVCIFGFAWFFKVLNSLVLLYRCKFVANDNNDTEKQKDIIPYIFCPAMIEEIVKAISIGRVSHSLGNDPTKTSVTDQEDIDQS